MLHGQSFPRVPFSIHLAFLYCFDTIFAVCGSYTEHLSIEINTITKCLLYDIFQVFYFVKPSERIFYLRVQPRPQSFWLSPDDKLSRVDHLPTAAVDQDASVSHHGAGVPGLIGEGPFLEPEKTAAVLLLRRSSFIKVFLIKC